MWPAANSYNASVKPLEGFEGFSFAAGGIEKTVYRRGTGPAVVLIHEMPGLSPPCVDLGRRLSEEGYAVYLPLLFGEPLGFYGIRPLLWPCLWREFNLLKSHGESPAADWLRALASRAHAERGGKGVGAIGMCLTGGFALSMMLAPELIAPVVSQPSLPILPWKKAALGVSEREWDNAKRRCREGGVPVLGFRFEGDPLCPPERFRTLRDGLGAGFRAVEVPGDKHSVLTYHFKDLGPEEQARVWSALTAFLRERLL